MALSGTFTLNSNYVILEAVEVTIVRPLTDCAIGNIIQVGSDVSDWAADDRVMYNNSATASFQNNSTTWQVINQSDIYFKYESPA
jgi:hypothetical protein